MTTAPPTYWTPPSRWGVGRILGVVIGVLLLLPGLGLVVGGGVLLWADQGNRTDGYVFCRLRPLWFLDFCRLVWCTRETFF